MNISLPSYSLRRLLHVLFTHNSRTIYGGYTDDNYTFIVSLQSDYYSIQLRCVAFPFLVFRLQRYYNFLTYARERGTFWHESGQNDTQGGQNGTKMDNLAGIEGLARRLQYSR